MKKTICRLLFVLVLAISINYFVPTVYAADLKSAEERIQAGLESGKTHIELAGLGLSCTELEELMQEMRYRNQWPWYMEKYSYTYHHDLKIVQAIQLTYLDPKTHDRELYDRELARIISRTVFPGMSQWQIALSIHDYLASHYAYDESLTLCNEYDMVAGGMGVCEGYARLYQDLLEMAGIESVLCNSDDMNHVWNLVKINGVWYHVDLTWDDPTSDCNGRVMHTFFLLDDQSIRIEEPQHMNWDTLESAPDGDTMSNGFWKQTNNQICYESASVSYFRLDKETMHAIYSRDELTGEVTLLDRFDAGFVDVGSGRYHYSNYGLSLWNGRLYYSDMEHVYSITTDGGDKRVEYTHDAHKNGTFIAGSMVDEGMLSLTFGTSGGQYSNAQIALRTDGDVHTHSFEIREESASCEVDGSILYVCACGDSFPGKVLPAIGHDFDKGTALGEGMVRYTCKYCGITRDEAGEVKNVQSILSGETNWLSAGGMFQDGKTVLIIIALLSVVTHFLWDKRR